MTYVILENDNPANIPVEEWWVCEGLGLACEEARRHVRVCGGELRVYKLSEVAFFRGKP